MSAKDFINFGTFAITAAGTLAILGETVKLYKGIGKQSGRKRGEFNLGY